MKKLIVLFLFFLAPQVHAAIAFDSSAQGTAANPTTSITWSHTCATNSVLVVQALNWGGNTISDVTFNGTSMTPVDNFTDVAGLVNTSWILLNCSGTHSVVISASNGGLGGESQSYTGADITTNPRDFTHASGTNNNGDPVTVSISTTAANSTLVGFAERGNSATTGVTGGTERQHESAITNGGWGDIINVGSGNNNYTATYNSSLNSQTWSVMVMALQPPQAATGTTNRLAKFTTPTTLGNSLLSDDGSNTTLTAGNLLLQISSLIDAVTGGTLNFGTTNATTMTFGRSGQNAIFNSKVGIGTSTPTAMLHVNGDLFANLINVGANGFGLDTLTSGVLSVGSTTASSITIGRVGATTTIPVLLIGKQSTTVNCNSSASPAVCGSSPSGSVAMATGGSTLVVNTTSVTPNSQIFITEDSSLGARLGITCNTTTGRAYSINARNPGTSFTIKSSTNPATNKACLSYWIIN